MAREDETLTRLLGEGETPRPVEVGTYGELPDQVYELYEFHEPAAPQPRPTLVVVHGGYFRPGVDRTHARPQARALTAAGWRVVLAEYRRVPGDPAATTDDLTALDTHLRASGHDVAAWVGHSAGGALVLWRATTPHLPPARAVALAPVADFAAAVAERLGSDAVRDWMGASPGDDPDRYARLDPTRLLAAHPAAAQRVTVLHGDEDVSVPLRQSQAWERAVLAGADHFDLIDPTSPHWPAVVDAIRRSAAPRRP